MNSLTGNRNGVGWLSLIMGFAVIVSLVVALIVARRAPTSSPNRSSLLAASSPVSWWPGASNANDVIGTNDGIVPSGVTFAPGKIGTAFSFDGVDTGRTKWGESFDAVRIPGFGMKLPSSEITIEFWQKVQGAWVQYGVSLSPYNFTHVCRCIAPYNDGKVWFDFGNNRAGGQLSYTPPVSIFGSWQHFAFVASQTGNFMKIYRNGILEAQKVGMTPFANIDCDLLIGDGFAGLIDEVKIYNRALSAAEILSIYGAADKKADGARSLTEPQ